MTLQGGEEPESFSGPGVELVSDARAGPLRDVGHALSLGQVLPDEAVGVLGSATFPGVVGGGEIELRACDGLDLFVAVELGAVIYGDGTDPPGGALDQGNGPAIGVLHRS